MFFVTGVGLKTTLKCRLDEAGVSETMTESVATNMAGYLSQSKADNTVKKYNQAFVQFEKYCISNSLTAKPSLPIFVAMYITSLLDQRKSGNVITSAVYGIKWAHKLNDLEDPTDSDIVKLLMETAKRIRSRPRQKKDAISIEMLQNLCSSYVDCTDVVHLRDLCMITLAYAGFLRFDEVSNLHCNDVKFNSDHLVLNIRRSKADV